MDESNDFLPRDEDISVATNRIKKRIRKMRVSQKVTIKEMAESLGISERVYSDKENTLKKSEFKLSEILAISKRLQVMAGLVVADFYHPETVGCLMRIVEGLREMEPDVKYCLDCWEQAKMGKTKPISLDLAPDNRCEL
jgi:transcriptional regulator with XRE-family HTH domain